MAINHFPEVESEDCQISPGCRGDAGMPGSTWGCRDAEMPGCLDAWDGYSCMSTTVRIWQWICIAKVA